MTVHTTEARVLEQGNVVSFITTLPINKLLEILEIPDPNVPFEDNRRVKIKHAREFGDYWENQMKGWIVPPLILDTEDNLLRRPIASMSENFCEIELPITKKWKLHILDGQHRVLGWHLKQRDIEKRLEEAHNQYNRAVFAKNVNLQQQSNQEIKMLKYLQQRLELEQVGVLIVTGINRQVHRQFFVDIAKNALGINKTVQAKFDVSSIVNRVASNIMESHPLLVNRVDTESTKCSGENENFLSVVNLADIIRHVGFGINNRVSSKKELIYSDDDLYQLSLSFFDIFSNEMSVLEKIQNGSVSAKLLRENSLLGSGTIWRCLAGAYHNYCVVDEEYEIQDVKRRKLSFNRTQQKKFISFVREFNLHSELPIERNWLSTGFFPKKTSTGPTSRSQDLLGMVKLFELWIDSGTLFEPRRLRDRKSR